MKKSFIALVLIFTAFLSACQEKKSTNRIYVFSQPGCMHCEHAKSYMDRYYANYDIKDLNIHEGNNMSYMLRYARKYKVRTQDLGTPFIVMGDNYIMGWGRDQEKKFNRYAKNFSPKPKSVR